MNEGELDEIASEFKLSGEKYEQKALSLLKLFNLKQVIVTCGEVGSWALDNKNKLTVAVANKTNQAVLDTVGAGDAFAAVYILGMLSSWDTMKTLERANQFAAGICSVRGAVPQSLDFYIPYMTDWKL
jgi:fructokinase